MFLARQNLRRILREKCPDTEFFLVRIFPHSEYGSLRSKSPYSVQMRENKDQKNSVFGHFSRSAKGFMHKVMDMIKIFCINTFTFILPCVKIQFKGRSREIGRLLSNRLSNVSLKLKIK